MLNEVRMILVQVFMAQGKYIMKKCAKFYNKCFEPFRAM